MSAVATPSTDSVNVVIPGSSVTTWNDGLAGGVTTVTTGGSAASGVSVVAITGSSSANPTNSMTNGPPTPPVTVTVEPGTPASSCCVQRVEDWLQHRSVGGCCVDRVAHEHVERKLECLDGRVEREGLRHLLGGHRDRRCSNRVRLHDDQRLDRPEVEEFDRVRAATEIADDDRRARDLEEIRCEQVVENGLEVSGVGRPNDRSGDDTADVERERRDRSVERDRLRQDVRRW